MSSIMHTKIFMRFYQTVKSHEPLIKFRYGVQEISKPNSTNLTSVTGTVSVMDQTELPIRFKRATLDEAEINAINSGGAE